MKLFRATKERPPLSPDRAAVRKKIEEYERLGDDYFSQNVEDDPPSRALQPDEVDYLCKKWGNKWNRMKARVMRRVMTHTGRKYYNIQVKGKENLRGLRHGGAIFTSNHFAFLENGAIEIASRMAPGRHRFHYVIREGNYFMDGTFGFLLRHCDTLPLPSCLHTMKKFNEAMAILLKKGHHILIYPEQSMWYNYKKPRPLQIGAFHMAAKNGVPVVPCFVSLTECGDWEENGEPHMHYTVHVMPPIYPDPKKTLRENAELMRRTNEQFCREAYERAYGIPLTYTCDEVDEAP